MKMTNILKRFYSLLLAFKYSITKQPSNLSDTRLESLLHQQVHFIEKGLDAEKGSDFILMIWARKLYFEALKRNLLSQEETEWCERILLGKQIELIRYTPNKSSDDEFTKIVRGRRSVRFWEAKRLKEEEFKQLVDSARWSPSSCNRQPCYFLLTRDTNKIKLLSDARGQKFVENAPSCILVLINTEIYDKQEVTYTPYLDAGAAIQNLLLKAQTLGLGACWVNFGTKEVPESKRREVKAVFEIPAHYEIISIIPIGIPKQVPLPPGRKSIYDISKLEEFRK